MFIVILIVVVVMSAGLLIAFGPLLFTQQSSGDPVYSYTKVIQPDAHDWVNWQLAQSLGIYGNFTVTPSSSEINFFICDEENYESFADMGSVTKEYELYGNAGMYRFKIPYADLWYLVLFNNGTEAVTVSLTLAQDATAPEIIYNLIPEEQYAGEVLVTATIIDTFDIEMVEFKVDDGLVSTQSGKSFSYLWDTTLWGNGIHNITISAQDNVGNSRDVTFPVQIIN
jgi:hypothetical protein